MRGQTDRRLGLAGAAGEASGFDRIAGTAAASVDPTFETGETAGRT